MVFQFIVNNIQLEYSIGHITELVQSIENGSDVKIYRGKQSSNEDYYGKWVEKERKELNTGLSYIVPKSTDLNTKKSIKLYNNKIFISEYRINDTDSSANIVINMSRLENIDKEHTKFKIENISIKPWRLYESWGILDISDGSVPIILDNNTQYGLRVWITEKNSCLMFKASEA